MGTEYVVQDGVVFTISFFATKDTLHEAADVADSLKVNGVPFDDWVKGFSQSQLKKI